jgi:hypothetical protein
MIEPPNFACSPLSRLESSRVWIAKAGRSGCSVAHAALAQLLRLHRAVKGDFVGEVGFAPPTRGDVPGAGEECHQVAFRILWMNPIELSHFDRQPFPTAIRRWPSG